LPGRWDKAAGLPYLFGTSFEKSIDRQRPHKIENEIQAMRIRIDSNDLCVLRALCVRLPCVR